MAALILKIVHVNHKTLCQCPSSRQDSRSSKRRFRVLVVLRGGVELSETQSIWGNVGKFIPKRRGAKRGQRLFAWWKLGPMKFGVKSGLCDAHPCTRKHVRQFSMTAQIDSVLKLTFSDLKIWWLWWQARWFVNRRLPDAISTRESYCKGRKTALLARHGILLRETAKTDSRNDQIGKIVRFGGWILIHLIKILFGW